MPYTVIRSDPSQPSFTVPDGTIDITDTSLTLVGRNYPNYGQAFADNFVHLLENFSSPFNQQPANPIEGQLWYNSTYNELFVFDGTSWDQVNVVYNTTSITIGNIANPPLGAIAILTDTSQLQIYTATGWQIPSNTDLTALSITTLPAETTTATTSATIALVDNGTLYNTTKSLFLGDVYPYLVSTGTIVLWPTAANTIPAGWLKCDGSSYLIAAYYNLYNLITTTYGSNNPSYFKVPNLTGPTTTDTSITLFYIIKT